MRASWSGFKANSQEVIPSPIPRPSPRATAAQPTAPAKALATAPDRPSLAERRCKIKENFELVIHLPSDGQAIAVDVALWNPMPTWHGSHQKRRVCVLRREESRYKITVSTHVTPVWKESCGRMNTKTWRRGVPDGRADHAPREAPDGGNKGRMEGAPRLLGGPLPPIPQTTLILGKGPRLPALPPTSHPLQVRLRGVSMPSAVGIPRRIPCLCAPSSPRICGAFSGGPSRDADRLPKDPPPAQK